MYHSFKVVILSLGWTLFLYTIVIILTPSSFKWTVSGQNGWSEGVKLDGVKVRKLTVIYETGRSTRAQTGWSLAIGIAHFGPDSNQSSGTESEYTQVRVT